MSGWLSNWFAWYQGGVWTNIAASFIWSGLVFLPTILHLHRKVDRQHEELKQQATEHHARLKKHFGITDDETEPTE